MRCPYCEQVISPQRWPGEYWPDDLVTCEHLAFQIPEPHASARLHPAFPEVFLPQREAFAMLWARILLQWIDPMPTAGTLDDEAPKERLRSRLVALLRASEPVGEGREGMAPPSPIWHWRRWRSFEEMMLAARDPATPLYDDLDLSWGSPYGSPEDVARWRGEESAHRVLRWCLEGFRRGREFERITWEKWIPPIDVGPPDEGEDFYPWDEETPYFRGDVLFRPSGAEAELSRQDALSELRYVTHLLSAGLDRLLEDPAAR